MCVERSRSVEEQLHVVVPAPLRIAHCLLLRHAGAPFLALRALLAIILVRQLVEHPRYTLRAAREGVAHRAIVASQSNGVKSAKSAIAEDPRSSGAGAKAWGLETTVQEGVWCKGRRRAGLRAHAELRVLHATEAAEVWGVCMVVAGWEAGQHRARLRVHRCGNWERV